NVTLPGGVVGDVHRGFSHGRDTSDVSRGLRAVAWERSAGQVVQVVITVAVLLLLPSPLGIAVPLVALAVIAVAAGVVRATRARPPAVAAWPAIVLTSAVVVAGHTATFLIAARSAGATAPLSQMLPQAWARRWEWQPRWPTE